MGRKDFRNKRKNNKKQSNIMYRFIAVLLISLVAIIGWITSNQDTPITTIDPIAILTKKPSATTSPDKITPTVTKAPTSKEQISTNDPTIKETTSDQKQSEQNVELDQAPELKVHFIDVGQADCILIESEGKFMLVDGGNNEDEDVILDYLSDAGVTKLEYIIATHPHEDHIGSLDRVVETYEATKIFAPHKEHTSKTYYDFLESSILKNQTLRQPKVGSEVMLGDCIVTFLAPNKDYGDDLNNWSIGLKVTNGVHTFVMCGDAEEDAEADILANGIDLKADVLKLGHHGSSTSTSDAFLKAVSPKYAVISVGEGNTYGHPHKETLSKMKEEGISLFRTDEQGTIIATSDGEEITWNVDPYEY